MWSHYADSHKGVCLEFGVRSEIYKEFNHFNSDPYKVNYPDNDYYPNFLYKNIPPVVSFWGQFLTKSKDWVEEEECRILSSKSGLRPFNKNSLHKIIFGLNTPEEENWTLQTLLKKLDYPNLTFARCVKLKFEITIEDFE